MNNFKKFLSAFLLIILFLGNQVGYAKTPLVIDSKTKIDSVTLFLNGAQVFRSGKVLLKNGKNEVSFTGISSSIVDKTLRISAPNNTKILSISVASLQRKDFKSKKLEAIQDSIFLVEEQVTLYKNELDALTEEKKLILANNQVETNGTISIQRLEELSALYRRKLREINNLIFKINKKIKAEQKTLKTLQNRQSKVYQKLTKTNRVIKILLEATGAQNAEFMLQYMVVDAVWKPAYTLKVDEIDKPINLEYLARVYNNTGHDWNNLPITLATTDPTQSADNPTLTTWILKNQENIKAGKGRLNNDNIVVSQNFQQVGGFNNFEDIEVSDLNIRFHLKNKQTIPADAIPHTLFIQKHDLDANYKHLSIPKMKPGAYLIAKITDWEELNLIEGPMTLFFKNTYVGESRLNPNIISDTLEMSLGKDNQVTVLRRKIKDESSTKFLGGNIKETMTYEIIMKNNYDSPLTLTLLEQVPISQDKDIQVKLIDLADAEMDEITGKLTWKVNLKPSEQKKIRFSFSIKYPKNKRTLVQKQKERNYIRAPKYF